MIKLVLKTKEGKEDIEQSVKVVAVPAFTVRGFEVVKEKHTEKEIKKFLKDNNVEVKDGAKLEDLIKLL